MTKPTGLERKNWKKNAWLEVEIVCRYDEGTKIKF